jgi:outer membrane protein
MQNRKSNILLIACFFSLLWLNSVNAADVAKIGVANLQRVLETSNQGKLAQEEIKKQKDQMQQELTQKGGEINELRKQLDRESMVMSREKREENEREVRIKINDFKSLEKRYHTQLQNLEKKLVSALLKEVSSLVKEIGKKEGYLLIINNTTVLYAPGSIDITDRLINEMNARHAKKSGD